MADCPKCGHFFYVGQGYCAPCGYVPTNIYSNQGSLDWHKGERLASLAEINNVPHDIGTIWEALYPGEILQLLDGFFLVKDDDPDSLCLYLEKTED